MFDVFVYRVAIVAVDIVPKLLVGSLHLYEQVLEAHFSLLEGINYLLLLIQLPLRSYLFLLVPTHLFLSLSNLVLTLEHLLLELFVALLNGVKFSLVCRVPTLRRSLQNKIGCLTLL